MLAALAAAAAFSFRSFYSAWRKNRELTDTPTSRVRSAAQGYVGFAGRACMVPESGNNAPLSGIECVWWQYEIEERGSRSWGTVDSKTSEAPFLLDDGTGHCLIDPRGAEIFSDIEEVWYGDSEWPEGGHIPGPGGPVGWLLDASSRGKYRYTERRLTSGQPLTALGGFHSIGGVSAYNSDGAVAELLRTWKRDQKTLLTRFDGNHDGQLSAAEWEQARRAAADQVANQVRSEEQAPPVNVLAKPEDGRSFVIATMSSKAVAGRLRVRAAAAVAAFVGCCSAFAWMAAQL